MRLVAKKLHNKNVAPLHTSIAVLVCFFYDCPHPSFSTSVAVIIVLLGLGHFYRRLFFCFLEEPRTIHARLCEGCYKL